MRNDNPATVGGVPPPQSVELVRAPLDLPPVWARWKPPVAKVNADGHMALGTHDAIAKDADRGIAEIAPPPPAEEFSDPASSNGYLSVLRAAEIPAEVVTGISKWLVGGVEGKSDSEAAAMDATDLAQTQAELQHLWGKDYQANVDALGRYVNGLPANQAEVFREARDPETGSAFANDPETLVRLAGLARSPQPQSDGPLTIESIERFMRSNRSAYIKDESLQARYRDLLAQRESQKGS